MAAKKKQPSKKKPSKNTEFYPRVKSTKKNGVGIYK